jgi:hypothetical protein
MIQNLYSGYVFIRYPVTITEIKERIGANHEYHEVFTPVSISNLDLAKLSRLVNKVVNSSFDKISPVTQNELIQNSMIYR